MVNFTLHIHTGSYYKNVHKSSDLQCYLAVRATQIILNKRKWLQRTTCFTFCVHLTGKNSILFALPSKLPVGNPYTEVSVTVIKLKPLKSLTGSP